MDRAAGGDLARAQVDAQRGAVEVKLALQAAPPDFLREAWVVPVGQAEDAIQLAVADPTDSAGPDGVRPVDGIDPAEFERIANEAKAGCPVSKALTGVEITVDAALES